LSTQALSDLLDRKPHLLRPLAVQLLPPPLDSIDPAKRLGVDLSSLRTIEDCRQALSTVLAAVVARGEIAPVDGARIAHRVGSRLRDVRRTTTLVGAPRPPASKACNRRSQVALAAKALRREYCARSNQEDWRCCRARKTS
jgi:hypothetical protein